MKRGSLWAWLWIILGIIYFFLPLIGTFMFSLRAKRDTLSFLAYENVFKDPKFWETFGFSALMAVFTIIVSLLLIVPTAYWVQLNPAAVCDPYHCACFWFDQGLQSPPVGANRQRLYQ
jgi:putative spermidine/putrescine transport system permease protein